MATLLKSLVKDNIKYREQCLQGAQNTKGLLKLSNINYDFNNNVHITDSSIVLPKNHKLINKYYTNFKNYKNAQEDYNTFISSKFPLIQEILVTVDSIVLCGGSALWTHCAQYTQIPNPENFNLFLYNKDSKKNSIQENIKNQNIKILKILRILNSNGIQYDMEFVKGCITIDANLFKIKIILKNYSSISEILHNFELPCCAIAYDGINTYLTKLCAWSLINKLNVIIPEYITDTYENELKKYFDRGYGIVFPFLEISKDCKYNMHISLSNLEIKINYITDNIIIGEIELPTLDILNPSIELESLNMSYIIDIQKNIYEENFKQIIKKKDNFQYIIKNANMIQNASSLTDHYIYDLIPKNIYIAWLHKYIKENIINGDFFINESFINMIFGNYNDIIDIGKTNVELKKLLKRAKKSNYKGNIYILNNLFSQIILQESQKYESIYKLKIDWNLYMPNIFYPCYSYKNWYGNYFNNKIKYTKQSIHCIKNILKIHTDEENNKSDIICSICLEQINYLTPNTIKLTCGHLFHEINMECCRGINLWLEKNNSCPECRRVSPKKIKKIIF